MAGYERVWEIFMRKYFSQYILLPLDHENYHQETSLLKTKKTIQEKDKYWATSHFPTVPSMVICDGAGVEDVSELVKWCIKPDNDIICDYGEIHTISYLRS